MHAQEARDELPDGEAECAGHTCLSLLAPTQKYPAGQVSPAAEYAAAAQKLPGAAVQLEQLLDAEGDQAKVYVYATFADNATQHVPSAEVVLAPSIGGIVVRNGTASDAASVTARLRRRRAEYSRRRKTESCSRFRSSSS